MWQDVGCRPKQLSVPPNVRSSGRTTAAAARHFDTAWLQHQAAAGRVDRWHQNGRRGQHSDGGGIRGLREARTSRLEHQAALPELDDLPAFLLTVDLGQDWPRLQRCPATIANDGPVCPPLGQPLTTKCSETLITRDAGTTYNVANSNTKDISGTFNALGVLGQVLPPVAGKTPPLGAFKMLTGQNGENWLGKGAVSQLQHWLDDGKSQKIVRNQSVSFVGSPGGEATMGQSGQIVRVAATGKLVAAFYGDALEPPKASHGQSSAPPPVGAD